MSRNLAASIRARLKQRADATKQDFNLTLTHYGLERLLYRLSVSPHAANYLLKGALLFSLWYDQPHRPTRDADLLGFGPDDIDTAVAAFREICQIEVEDGIAFDPASVNGSVIRKEAGYGGVRIDLRAKLDGARIALQVDIGFGDAVTPAPETVSYPVLLEDLPASQLRSYP
ncbi:MAG: nucleotidyl transferase AbiEii/AbiGii toxin family protein, partial [Comamonadaceae bacterium]